MKRRTLEPRGEMAPIVFGHWAIALVRAGGDNVTSRFEQFIAYGANRFEAFRRARLDEDEGLTRGPPRGLQNLPRLSRFDLAKRIRAYDQVMIGKLGAGYQIARLPIGVA